jgi:hypothetical protein
MPGSGGSVFALVLTITVGAAEPTLAGGTERVSVGQRGAQANRDPGTPPILADARYIAYGSAASHLVPGNTSEVDDVYVRRC